MIWIGINKNDPDQRKFEFDDSVVLTSDPPQYSIRFLDNNETTSIVCNNVFKLKPVKPLNNRKNSTVVDKPPVKKQEFIEESDGFGDGAEITDEELQREIADELRPVWEKQKNKQVLLNPTPTTITDNIVDTKKKTTRKKKADETTLDATQFPTGVTLTLPEHKYEYKTILVDLESVSSLQDKLNELGEKYWELVNFEVVQSILPNKSRLFCILKRNKQ
jgi:hypothetical protein